MKINISKEIMPISKCEGGIIKKAWVSLYFKPKPLVEWYAIEAREFLPMLLSPKVMRGLFL
jgi:hypothetical protein